MNIYLLPYTWLRHLAMPLWCAGAGLIAWWLTLGFTLWVGPRWPSELDGPILLCAITGAVSMAAVLGEANLRRFPLRSRAWRVAMAGGITVGLTFLSSLLWGELLQPFLFSFGEHAANAADESLVSLSYRVGLFFFAGLSTGLGPIAVRKGQGWVEHIAAGIVAGLAGALVWHGLGQALRSLYVASAGLGLTWGFVFGLVAWGIPDELYAGWIRVCSPNRQSVRIPVDAPDGGPRERFVGHFPRGLDLFLPPEDGVQELHIAVAVDAKQRYAVRGLSLYPTIVKRFLEKVDLRYDARLPAPLETRLRSGDRVRFGNGEVEAEIEFLMLPREES